LGSDHPDVANSLNNLAGLYRNQGRYSEAEPLYKRALSIREKVLGSDHPDVALSLNSLAGLYRNQGRYSEAEPLYKRALSIVEKVLGSEHPDVANSLNNLAGLYRNQGRYSEAEELYKRALNIYEKVFGLNHQDVATSMNNLAVLFDNQGKYSEAESLYIQALNIYEKLLGPNHTDVATSLNNLALLYDKQGRYSEAEGLYKRSLNIYKELLGNEHPYLATSMNNLAGLYKNQGRYSEAEELYKRALYIYEKVLCPEHPNFAAALNNLGLLYDNQGRYSEAEVLFKKALQNLLNQIKNYFPSMSEKEKGEFLKTIKDNFEIFNSFSIKRMKEDPKILNDMLNLTLNTKAILLNSSKKIQERILSSKDSGLIEKYKLWKEKREYINKAYSMSKEELESRKIDIKRIEEEANEIEKELSRRSEEFEKVYEKKIVDWKEIQKKLKDEEAIVEVIRFNLYEKGWTDMVYYAFLIVKRETKEYPEIVIKRDGNSLEDEYLRDYKSMLKMNDKVSYKRYWSDVQEKLRGIKRIYYSPDGVYNQININTLKMGDGEYLINKIEIHQVTNTKDLLVFGEKSKKLEKTLEIFGDPDFSINVGKYKNVASNYVMRGGLEDTEGFREEVSRNLIDGRISELPGTRVEVEEISKIMINRGWKVNKHVRWEAIEGAVKRVKNPSILHIATHGFFLSRYEVARDYERGRGKILGRDIEKVYENPLLRSGILLSGANIVLSGKSIEGIDDGLLTAYEVMNLELDSTDIVVLSACQTGGGEVVSGEGVYGLQRAFIVAGSKRVIMSLWNVDDEATQELMRIFYENYSKGRGVRESFNEAQRDMMKRYNAPYYWGAFVIVGE